MLTTHHSQKTTDELISMWKHRRLNLSPAFQRQSVWGKKDRQLLVQSVLDGVPLPSIYLYRQMGKGGTPTCDVIDGKQRLETRPREALQQGREDPVVQCCARDRHVFPAGDALATEGARLLVGRTVGRAAVSSHDPLRRCGGSGVVRSLIGEVGVLGGLALGSPSVTSHRYRPIKSRAGALGHTGRRIPMNATGYPWYDDELMALRATQRRWLYAIPRRDDGPSVPDLKVSGLDAIACERSWRGLLDELVSDEWRPELERVVASQQAVDRIALHRRAMENRYPDSRVEEAFHHAAVEAQRVAGRPGIHHDEYRGLLHLLDVAEVLASAADQAVGR